MITDNPQKLLIIKALRDAKGDDLPRARAAFRSLSVEQLQMPYGDSGKTCAELLTEYELKEAAFDAAISWVEKL